MDLICSVAHAETQMLERGFWPWSQHGTLVCAALGAMRYQIALHVEAVYK